MLKRIGALLLLGGIGCVGQSKKQACSVTFSVVRHDLLGNTDAGLSKGDAKWYAKGLAKKYPAVCYAKSGGAALLFDVAAVHAVHHGSRTVYGSSTSTTSGTVTDESGASADINATTTTDHDRTVPTETRYLIFELDIKRLPDGSTLRRFQQSDLYARQKFTFGFGKSAHPTRALIEEAVKWLASNSAN